MKKVNDLFNWYKTEDMQSEWRDNILRLKDAVEGGYGVNFTKSTYIISIENLILEYTFKDYEMVVRCLMAIHEISHNESKLLLIRKLTDTVIKVTELGDD